MQLIAMYKSESIVEQHIKCRGHAGCTGTNTGKAGVSMHVGDWGRKAKRAERSMRTQAPSLHLRRTSTKEKSTLVGMIMRLSEQTNGVRAPKRGFSWGEGGRRGVGGACTCLIWGLAG